MLARVLLAALVLAGCTAPAPSSDDPSEEPYGVQDPVDEPAGASECPRLAVEGLAEPFRLGEPVRFVVSVDNCAASALALASDCYHEAAGPVVDIGLPEGPRATLEPSDAPVPADAGWSCDHAPGSATLASGQVERYAFAWDGRVSPFCPERTGDSVGCEGTRVAAVGAYEAAVSLALPDGSRNALATIAIVDDSVPRVPVILVNETYEVSRAPSQPQLPARREGCPDATFTRAPWTATLLREGAPARALVVREFPQGGFGNFGPEALVLPENGTLALLSAFEPGRVLGVLEDAPEGVRFLGESVGATPRTSASAYETTWEGETYSVRETLDVLLAGEAWLFPPAAPQGC